MIRTAQEGVITLFDEQDELIGIVIKDMKSRKNVFYKTSEMGFEEIAELIDTTVKQIT